MLNHYWTREFFEIVGSRWPRESSAHGDRRGELHRPGAGVSGLRLATLQSVFGHVVLKPGEESWLVASDGEGLSTAPAELRDRFANIPAAAEVYPAQGLMSLYVPDRAEFPLEAYSQTAAAAPAALLLNRDERPISLFFSLLLALRPDDAALARRDRAGAASRGIWIAACPIVIYGLLRLLYLLARARPGDAQSITAAAAFDGRFLVFATGLAGMSRASS